MLCVLGYTLCLVCAPRGQAPERVVIYVHSDRAEQNRSALLLRASQVAHHLQDYQPNSQGDKHQSLSLWHLS